PDDAAAECDSARACRPRGYGDAASDLPDGGRGADGHRDHDFDNWLRERADAGWRAHLLRDGLRRALLPGGGASEQEARAGAFAADSGDMVRVPGAAAHIRHG